MLIPEKKTQGIETTGDTKQDLHTLMENVKDSVKDFTKNPDNVKGALAALSIATLAFMFRPEEQAKFEEDTREEMEDLRNSGQLTEEEAIDMEAYYEKIDNNTDPEIAIEEPPVITTAKMRAVNIDAINKGNRKRLRGYKKIKREDGTKEWVINNKIDPEDRFEIDDSVYKIGSYNVLRPKHLANFDTFKERICNVFQPDLKDNPAQQVENSARALSYCALGIYQILPIHHFGKMGWGVKGKEGLKNMYDFILSKEKQKELNMKILISDARKFGGNIDAIAASYYGGMGKEVLTFRKSESTVEPEWFTKKQGKYGSIKHYASRVHKHFKRYYGEDLERVNVNDKRQMEALRNAIGKKETG